MISSLNKIKENSYQKIEEERHTETKSKYFNSHSCLSQSEESECMWTHDKDH